MTPPPCPSCQSDLTYEDADNFVCPECAHEWPQKAPVELETVKVFKDASGNLLQDGDTVTLIKDLKLKGSSSVIKVGTKVRNIRLVSPVDGHDIDAKVDGFGQVFLKSSVVKRAN